MSANSAKPHILVLPEDDANRQLARGFELEIATRQFQVLPPAGGWLVVLRHLVFYHSAGMRKFQNRHMVLLIDFDGDPLRRVQAEKEIPHDVRQRVFVLGALIEPENLKRDLGSLESIGQALAQECRNDSNKTWEHRMLIHNATEIGRLRSQVRRILFP